MNNINKCRIKKELEMFLNSPCSEISCTAMDDERLDTLSAQIIGASGTPYEGGTFVLEIQIPDRYPFEPPRIRFVTPIYHPNIDTDGRICMDTLKVPPKGTWRPFLNISTVLMMIRVLMGEPGSEDPLMTDIWQEFKYDYVTYATKAKEWTQLYATNQSVSQVKMVKQSLEVKEKNAVKDSTTSEIRSTLKLKVPVSKDVCKASGSNKTVLKEVIGGIQIKPTVPVSSICNNAMNEVIDGTQMKPIVPVRTVSNSALKVLQTENQENQPTNSCPGTKKRKLRLH